MDKLLNRIKKLTDEKYDWLEERQQKAIMSNDRFDIDRESDIWYTMKIAELQIIVESLQETQRGIINIV